MRWVVLTVFFAAVAFTAAPARADTAIAELRHDDADRRAKAAAQAAARGLRQAIPILIALLEDRSPVVRLAAVRALHRMRAKAATKRLLFRAQIDSDRGIREAAAKAVLAISPKAFASRLGTADPPPIERPPLPPLRPRATYATLFTLGIGANTLRIDESVGGNVGFGLRWSSIEAHLALGYPAMTLGLRVRWLLIAYPRFTPYLSAGAAVAYNNGKDDQRAAVALQGGFGLRYYFIPPIFVQVEAHASYTVHAPLRQPPSGELLEVRRFSLPVFLELGLELWP